MPPVHLYAPRGVHTPIGPHALLCTCMVLEYLHVVGVVICLNVCWDTSLTPPLFGGASPLITPPHFIVGSLCIVILRDIRYLMWAFSPSIEGFGGVPPSLWEVWGNISSSAVHMLILVPFFSALCLTF